MAYGHEVYTILCFEMSRDFKSCLLWLLLALFCCLLYKTFDFGYFHGVTSLHSHPELSPLCKRMWNADKNRLFPGVDYKINPQGEISQNSRQDRATYSLFTWVDPRVFERPTFKKFIALLDNYESETGREEVVTQQEKHENQHFIDAIYETEPMKIAHEYLAGKGLVAAGQSQFKRQLYDMWFTMYSRTGDKSFKDSSGFEHVFVGESQKKKANVAGFHNWIQFYLQEKKGLLDYKGFYPSRREKHITSEDWSMNKPLTVRFNWKGDLKRIGGSFIGTSPEFEMALCTVCFLAREGDGRLDRIELDDYDVIVKAHRFGANLLSTCYPINK